jgi:hypothetical protein
MGVGKPDKIIQASPDIVGDREQSVTKPGIGDGL